MKQFDRFLVAYNQLDNVRSDGRGGNVLLECLKFLAVLVFAGVTQTILANLLVYTYMLIAGATGFSDASGTAGIIISLFSTFGMIGATMLALRFAFKRELSTAGFTKPFWSEYGLGLLAGFAVFALAVGIAAAAGTLTIAGISPDFSPLPWLLIFVGFLVQGMSEELLCRGMFMINIARKNSVAAAIFCNALFFAALHLLNNGIAPLALVNLFLFGVFASLYYLWRGNIWGIAAFHSIWNFAQGNVFGILVSGGEFGTSLLSSNADPAGALINGGSFGLEGGLAVTAVLVLGIAFVMWRNLHRLAGTPMPLEGME